MRALCLVGMCVAASTLHAQSPELPPAPGRLIDVDGRRLHILCSGSGSPTVVLEAGASSFAIDWTLVQRELAATTRVCSYDRAGMGWSDAGTLESRVSTARDLHRLLRAAGERPPYVLVGASRGGLFIRAYQADHPSDVVGMVFVDPSTEERLLTVIEGRTVPIARVTAQELRATNPTTPVAVPRRRPQSGEPFDRLPPELYRLRIMLDEKLIASVPDTVGPEIIAVARESERQFLARLDSLRGATGYPLASLPTVVLSRGGDPNPDREAAHAGVARLSTNSYHCIVAGAGHEIHLFEPGAVVKAIRHVVDAAREGGRLPAGGCGTDRAAAPRLEQRDALPSRAASGDTGLRLQ